MFDVSTTRLSALVLLGTIALHLSPLSPALAQGVSPVAPAATNAAAAAPLVPAFAPDVELLGAFGGKQGIGELVDAFVDELRLDPRVGHYFEKTKIPRFKTQLADQICQLLAGPCVYDGDSMQAAHTDLNIPKADFLRVVEVLQSSMDQRGIPFTTQNRLLTRLAPMHRDIITR